MKHTILVRNYLLEILFFLFLWSILFLNQNCCSPKYLARCCRFSVRTFFEFRWNYQFCYINESWLLKSQVIFFTPKVSTFRTKSVNRNLIEPKQKAILSIVLKLFILKHLPWNMIYFFTKSDCYSTKAWLKEIEFKNLKKFKDSNLEYEFKHNIEYLNEISLCIRQKDLILAKEILREVANCEKIMSNSYTYPRILIQANSLKSPETDEYSQTDEEKFLDEPINFCTAPNSSHLSNLAVLWRK